MVVTTKAQPVLLVPQTLAVPLPPQVAGEVQVPQLVTVRAAPQLSMPLTAPQFLASRPQKVASDSGLQEAPGSR